MRKKVFICSPFRGDVEGNSAKAAGYCRRAYEEGHLPIAPHLLYPQFMDDSVPAERSLALFMGIVLLGKCDQMWVFGKVISAGMKSEIEKAEKKKMLIRYFTEELEEVKGL